MPDLGEQALNKVAEMGISSQLDEVENLEVDIKTDPLKLVSGAVDSVTVKGEGLVMKQDLRIEEMELNTGSVAINPLTAAFGKIELTRPTEAEANVVLTEDDINRAFNSAFIQDKMQNLHVNINGQQVTVDTQQVNFALPGDRKIALSTDVKLPQTGETKRIAFTAVPQVGTKGQSVTLTDVEYTEGQDLSSDITDALLNEVSELLDLRNFELEGISFRLKSLKVEKGKLTLLSQAHVEQFPES